MNSIVLAGNLGRDAELRHTSNGDAVLQFSVADSQGRAMSVRMPVPGTDGHYEVDDHGNVYSVARTIIDKNGNQKTLRGKRMSPRRNQSGYLVVHLRPSGRSITPLVHRITLSAFVPQPKGKPFVNHKNGIRHDNRLENLEWCDRSENAIHAYRVLGIESAMKGRTGRMHVQSKPVIATSLATGEKTRFDAYQDASRAGFSASGICACIHGRQKSHYGHTWELERSPK